jgi:hypothetical protein
VIRVKLRFAARRYVTTAFTTVFRMLLPPIKRSPPSPLPLR